MTETKPSRPYNASDVMEYIQAQDPRTKTCDCIECRKRIPMDGKHCVGFGVFVCDDCRPAREAFEWQEFKRNENKRG